MKIENGILKRQVDSTKHYHRLTKSYMFDSYLMEKYKEWNELQIITKYGRVYSISKLDFDLFSKENNDYGKSQIMIQTKYLHLKKQNENLKMIAVFEDLHEKIKESAKALNLTINDYIALKCAS